MRAALEGLLDDKERALSAYERYFLGEISLLLEVTRPGGSSLLEEWKMFCQKEKAVYVTLNQFQGTFLLQAVCVARLRCQWLLVYHPVFPAVAVSLSVECSTTELCELALFVLVEGPVSPMCFRTLSFRERYDTSL